MLAAWWKGQACMLTHLTHGSERTCGEWGSRLRMQRKLCYHLNQRKDVILQRTGGTKTERENIHQEQLPPSEGKLCLSKPIIGKGHIE